jgi:hypothetical protein
MDSPRLLRSLPARRRFRFVFSLRTLLLLFVVAAALFGWVRSKIAWVMRQRVAAEQLQHAGVSLEYQYGYANTPKGRQLGPYCLRAAIGDKYFA